MAHTDFSHSDSNDVNFAARSETVPTENSKTETAEIENWRAGTREWLILGCLTVVTLIVALDATILVPVLPTLADSLHGKATDTFWAGTSYLLASAVVQPFLVNLSDVFGRRSILLLSITFFTIGTAICCVAHNFTILLSGRSVQGIGGGGCLVLTQVIITDIIPLRQRAAYQSLTSLSWALATITGPLIGGSLAEASSWRWCFYINFPFCFVSFGVSAVVIRIDIDRPSLSLFQKLQSIDWIGGGLFIISTTTLLMGITWAGSEFAWSSAAVIAPILLGLLFLTLTIGYEIYGTKIPFLKIYLFHCLSSNAAFFCAFIQGLAMFLLLYYIPFFFIACKAASPRKSGVDLIPITAALMPVSIVVSLLIKRYGRYRWAIWAGWTMATTSAGLLILLSPTMPAKHWIPIFILSGFGHGAIILALITCVQATAPRGNVAEAAAAYTFLRSLGMCVGVAIGGTVFQNALARELGKRALQSSVASDAEAFLAVLNRMALNLPERIQYVNAYAAGLRTVWEVLMGLSALGLIGSFLIKGVDMNQHLDSEHVLRKKGGTSDGKMKVATKPVSPAVHRSYSQALPPIQLVSPFPALALPARESLDKPVSLQRKPLPSEPGQHNRAVEQSKSSETLHPNRP